MRSATFITLSQEYKVLIKDILQITDESMQKREKHIKHLRFARPTRHGWSFFKRRYLHWDMLDEISQKVHALHPHYGKGTIAHILSEVVNMTTPDLSRLQAEL